MSLSKASQGCLCVIASVNFWSVFDPTVPSVEEGASRYHRAQGYLGGADGYTSNLVFAQVVISGS